MKRKCCRLWEFCFLSCVSPLIPPELVKIPTIRIKKESAPESEYAGELDPVSFTSEMTNVNANHTLRNNQELKLDFSNNINRSNSVSAYPLLGASSRSWTGSARLEGMVGTGGSGRQSKLVATTNGSSSTFNSSSARSPSVSARLTARQKSAITERLNEIEAIKNLAF